MAITITPIYTQVADSSVPGTINFNNIPQFYTDLQIVISARTTSSPAGGGRMRMGFNNETQSSNYSSTLLSGNGSSAFSLREPNSGNLIVGAFSLGSDTANTFTNTNIYIPNYTASTWKQVSSESVKESNSTTITTYDGQSVLAGLWKNTAAITSVYFSPEGGGFAANSTITIYGIIRPGA